MIFSESHSRKRRIRLIYLFIGLVLSTTLITTCIQAISGYSSEKKILSSTMLQFNYERASSLSVTMEVLFSAMEKSLKVTSGYLSKPGQSEQDLQEQLNLALESSNFFNSMTIADENGVIRTASPENLGLTGKHVNATVTQKLLSLKGPYVSEPYYSLTNRLIVLMSQPMFDSNGKYLGFIAGTIYLDKKNVLNEVFGKTTASSSGTYVYVVDNAGNLLFHPTVSRIGENVSRNKIVQELMNDRSGSGSIVNTKNMSFLAGYSTVKANGWGIVVQSPKAEISAAAYRLVTNQILVSLPFVALFLLLAIWIARALSIPIAALSEAAQRISKGERMVSLPFKSHWNYEAHQLTRSLILASRGLQKQADALTLEANTDPLTGLMNRRAMDAYIDEWRDDNVSFSVMTLDIDHFKQINDSFGHQLGDEVLKFLASVMMNNTEQSDICIRIGGEEFVILLPETTPEQARLKAESIRKKMEKAAGPTGNPVTVSIGISGYPWRSSNLMEVFRFADEALYEAKRSGRNRTVIHRLPPSG
jgi:diguanylate cyclase (GGDEF)-like protein